MKRLISILLFSVSALGYVGCSSDSIRTKQGEAVSFYDVPLVCGADTSIGCGSRAKPPLLAMEAHPAIKEAWLNRQGTVYAVIWENEEQTTEVAQPIFEKFKIEFDEESVSEATANLRTFRNAGQWYRGKDVDQLSIEEAGTIASTYVGFSLDRQMISAAEAARIKPPLEQYFKVELVKMRSPEQLYEDSEKKFRHDAVAIFEAVIGKERTERLLAMYTEFEKEQCKKKESCCTEEEGSSKKCCES